ncbi:MAG TPA: ABC transporter ATP-binding protein [Chthoniobacterales bacterium]|jgi:ABC-2 type transport system ATP-binding protein
MNAARKQTEWPETARTDAARRGLGQEKVLSIQDLSVRLSLQRERVTSIREYTIRLLKGKRVKAEEFWPLQNISFEVGAGEVFGIVGPNGAGKSTLLRVIAGIIKPSKGTVRTRGRVAPLIELGAGFDPEMTGRENLYLYGSLLGFSSKRITGRLADIVAFSELEEFLDVPIKNYSSGMTARLAFAVATDVDPDLLLIDELLSVGDASFSKKCQDRIQEFRDRGVSILIVSHNLNSIKEMCSRVAWIDHGRLKMIGPASEVANEYGELYGAATPSVVPSVIGGL